MDTVAFMERYGFDLDRLRGDAWVRSWEERFPALWVIPAMVEALYQGRYKAVSVEQLLRMWRDRNYPRLSFGLDFTRKVWPEVTEEVQKVLVQTGPSSFQLRKWQYQAFDTQQWYREHRGGKAITIYRLRQQLREQPLPHNLGSFSNPDPSGSSSDLPED
ncbi:MAG: hypothetical protein AAFX40_15725 [Cyanobacteria bacterium J06639_1]